MFIDDCVKGTQAILHSSITEPINLGSDELVTINGLVDMVEDIAGVRLKRTYNLTAPKGVNGRNSDNTRIRALLGWAPSITLREGLEKTYAWIYDQHVGRRARRHASAPGGGMKGPQRSTRSWSAGTARMGRARPRLAALYHYFHPDDVVSARHFSDFCQELVARGWQVEALPCTAGCRDEKKAYRRMEEWNGVSIRRVWRPRFRQASTWGRLLNATWMIVAWSTAIVRRRNGTRPDVLLIGTDPVLSVLVSLIGQAPASHGARGALVL